MGYVNIGGETIINSDEIVGIFDIDKTTVHKNNRNYLSNAEKRGKIISVAEKIPKSFIVCKNKSENMVYITPLAPITLFKRISEQA